METKQQIIDRIMRLEKELSDAEAELQNCDIGTFVALDDIVSGMVFCPPPNGRHSPIIIIQSYHHDKYAMGGFNNTPFNTWAEAFTKDNLKSFLEEHKYEKVGLLTTNFNLMRHSSEMPF